jgi:hypothetical protein
MKGMIIPVIIGASGIVTKGKEKFINHTRKTFNTFTKR